MAENYILMTDSDSDIPFSYVTEHNIPVVQMPYMVDGREYLDDLGQTIDHKTYFDMMRNGATPTTAAQNEAYYLEFFEPYLAEGHDILFIAFSSKMSATINALRAAKDELLEKYTERKFRVVDTLSISAPQTILVMKAKEMQEAGKSLDEVGDWVEANKLRAQAWLTVDDLKYLQRGGRIKPLAAALGTMLGLKPILTESRDGLIVSVDKVRGRRTAVAAIVKRALDNIEVPEEACPIIVHADDAATAGEIARQLKEKEPRIGEVLIHQLGPVIGAHCGPGTVALCFLGKERTN